MHTCSTLQQRGSRLSPSSSYDLPHTPHPGEGLCGKWDTKSLPSLQFTSDVCVDSQEEHNAVPSCLPAVARVLGSCRSMWKPLLLELKSPHASLLTLPYVICLHQRPSYHKQKRQKSGVRVVDALLPFSEASSFLQPHKYQCSHYTLNIMHAPLLQQGPCSPFHDVPEP